MDIRDELRAALDDDQFSSPALLAQAMARLDAPRYAKRQGWEPLVAAGLTVVLVLTLVVVRATHDGFNIPGHSATLPVSSSVSGLNSYQFISPNVGWVAISTTGGTIVAKTSDGGRTWRRQLELVAVDLPSSSALQFFGPDDGVLIGQYGSAPTVWRTTDGGATWQEHRLTWNGQVRLVSGYFLDARQGWMLILGPDSSGSIYRTTDGANSWSQAGSVGAEAGLAFTGIRFSTPSTGFITTSGGAPFNVWDGPLPVFITNDGGVSWSRLELRALSSGLFFEALTSIAGNTGILIVGTVVMKHCVQPSPTTTWPPPTCDGIGEYPGGRYLYSTRDAGLTWSDPQGFAQGYMDLVDSQRWLLLNANSLSVSTDAGETWSTPHALAVPSGWFATQARFLDARRGWVTLSDTSEGNIPDYGGAPWGRYALVFTSDGGSSWQAVPLPSGLPETSPAP